METIQEFNFIRYINTSEAIGHVVALNENTLTVVTVNDETKEVEKNLVEKCTIFNSPMW